LKPNDVSKKSKSDATRERILKAALEMFHERGFDATTMRDIAAQADMAIGAAYYYFASKDAIVLAFYDRARVEMEPKLEQALRETRDLRKRLHRLIKVKLDYFAPSRELLGALSAHTNPRSPLSPFSQQTRALREHDIAFFQRALEDSSTRGHRELKKHLPVLLWMYQMGIILFWINDGSRRQVKTEVLLDKTLDIVVRLIRMSSLPLTGPIRRSVTQLLDTLMA
jgi:AcrR family transcriptional regulator